MKKKIFDEYFYFTVSEKRSILIVSILIVIGVITSFLVKHLPNKKEEFSTKQLSEIYELVTKLSETEDLDNKSENYPKKKSKTLFVFDPNTVSKNDLKKLGFSKRQISTIENYLDAGGKFYQKQDFMKIYNISEEEYNIYESYIRIDNSDVKLIAETEKEEKQSSIVEKFSSEFREDKLEIVEINSASTNDLTLIKGIGEVFANRIFKFRELLGGFYDEEQLLEVYGLNDTIFQQIKVQIQIDTSIIRTINLKTVSYKELIKHPYLDSYNTKAILNYRKFTKSDISKADLLRDNILPIEVYRRVSPYFIP